MGRNQTLVGDAERKTLVIHRCKVIHCVEIQFLFNFKFRARIAKLNQRVGRLNPTKWTDFSYQMDGLFPTKRTGFSYQMDDLF